MNQKNIKQEKLQKKSNKQRWAMPSLLALTVLSMILLTVACPNNNNNNNSNSTSGSSGTGKPVDIAGTFVREFGSRGTGDRQFNSPIGIAINNNLLYITDFNNHRIQTLSIAADGTLAFVRTFGSMGTGNGEFNVPNRLAIHNNLLYVADSDNNRIQVFR